MSISSLHFFRNKLWMVASGEETVSTVGASPDLERELTEVRARKGRLWVFDPGSQQLQRPPAGLGGVEVTAICSAGDRLWLAGDGVVRYHLDSDQTRRFGVADGLEVLDTLALASSGEKLYVEGVRSGIAALDLDGEHWESLKLPVIPSRAASNNGRVLSGAAGKVLRSSGGVWLYEPAHRNWTNLAELSGIRTACGDESGVWAGGIGCLHYIDFIRGSRQSWQPRLYRSWQDSGLTGIPYDPGRSPSGPSLAGSEWDEEERMFWSFQRFQRERKRAHVQRELSHRSVDEANPGTRLPPGTVTALLRDGEYLWIGCSMEDAHCLLLVHRPSFSWVGHWKLRAAVASLAVSSERLWIGLSSGNQRLLQVDKRAVVATPRQQWRDDKVSEQELASLIERQPVREQARHAFFRGDYTLAARLLERLESSASDVERLFLLAYSHDSLGLAKPEIARRYFSEIISHHPDSVWARVAKAALDSGETLSRWSTGRAPIAADATEPDPASDSQLAKQIDQFLKGLDPDGDGKLNPPEIRFICSVITTHLRAKRLDAPLPPPMVAWAPLISDRLPTPDVLLLQYDTNCDDGLDTSELLALAKALRKE